jgi:uncharacterized protein DUF6524
MKSITMAGIGVRFVIAFLLVALTWNPTRYNYVAWVMGQFDADASTLWPLVAFSGVCILIAWGVFLRATARSLGPVGLVLAVGLCVVVVWILVYYGVVDMQSTRILSWIVLVLLAAILAAGMSWSHLRRAWAGQADVDDVDER